MSAPLPGYAVRPSDVVQFSHLARAAVVRHFVSAVAGARRNRPHAEKN